MVENSGFHFLKTKIHIIYFKYKMIKYEKSKVSLEWQHCPNVKDPDFMSNKESGWDWIMRGAPSPVILRYLFPEWTAHKKNSPQSFLKQTSGLLSILRFEL